MVFHQKTCCHFWGRHFNCEHAQVVSKKITSFGRSILDAVFSCFEKVNFHHAICCEPVGKVGKWTLPLPALNTVVGSKLSYSYLHFKYDPKNRKSIIFVSTFKGFELETKLVDVQYTWAVFNILLSFHYTGWFIGTPLLDYHYPQYIESTG